MRIIAIFIINEYKTVTSEIDDFVFFRRIYLICQFKYILLMLKNY